MNIKIDHNSPILIVCQAGLDRSACLKIELVAHRNYSNVINVGVDTADQEILNALYNWAKLIIVPADESVWAKIPWEIKGKAVFENIGPDVWHTPTNPMLEKICKQIANKLKLV